ncbi:PD-(D/E)XK nuclease family protein [Streptosporangium sp. NBC_01639]|uniref:PD-(D/E)XK nuclease family protein n=1 Tax=Streptosporangium sp. NBC_01639 TaxID=2975948 RepID=UPI00386B8C4C|nr:PD-(D/E)XK nuclease family protein [Streptosporangium sp. NBC_01639]
MTLRSELVGNPDIVRLSASMLDRRESDCGDFAAAKARPDVRPQVFERRRFAPWESFPLGLVMQVLDAVEFDGADVDEAVGQAVEGNRDPVHPGAARWILHACRTYLETAESLAAEGGDLRPERHPRIVQRSGSPAEMRALTAWGRWYGSPDGTVVEFRRLRLRRPLGRAADPATLAMAYVAAAGDRAVGGTQDLYRSVPVPVREPAADPARVRVVEVGLTDGAAAVLVDTAPEDVRRAYLASARPVATGLLAGGHRSPGGDCADCKLRASCGTLPRTPGLLGLPDRGTHRRTWSITTARQYQICPAQAHMRDLRLPADDSESAAVRRGLVVHRWLEITHGRPGAGPCTPEGLPDPETGDLAWAGPAVSRDDYRQAWPYLLQHLRVCPLAGGGVTHVTPEPRVAAYDSDADVLVVANPDLIRRVNGRLVYREQKTSAVHRGITAENALDLVPQLALAVCLIADGAFGDTGGLVELEQLTPASGDVVTFNAGDPEVLATARAVVSDRARAWHRDVAFRPTPGPWCRVCPMTRWCPDAADTGDGATLVLDGLVIDPSTGEILRASGRVGSRAEAVAEAIAVPSPEDEPAF